VPETTTTNHRENLQHLLAVAIKNGSVHYEPIAEIEATCRFVAAAFFYRDFPTIEQILERENDHDVVEAANEALRRAGLRGAK